MRMMSPLLIPHLENSFCRLKRSTKDSKLWPFDLEAEALLLELPGRESLFNIDARMSSCLIDILVLKKVNRLNA
jgi:hypothetical protein